MSNMKIEHAGGGGGPEKPQRTDDNLFSEDIVEFALAISEGPIRGLTEGAKSFQVGDTPLVSQTGGRNFDKFAIGVHPGYNEDDALPLELKLGGITSNSQVGVLLVQNVPVTRQTESILRNTIDELEVRIYFNRLMRIDDEGGTFNNSAVFKIEYKATNSPTWLGFYTPYIGGDFWLDQTSDVFYNRVGSSWVSIQTGATPTATTGVVADLWNRLLDDADGSLNIERSSGPPDSLVNINAVYIDILGDKTSYIHNGAEWVEKATLVEAIASPLGLDPFWNAIFIGVPNSLLTYQTAVPDDKVLSIYGKSTNGVAKDYTIKVPRLTDADWEIRVTKLSEDNSELNVVVMTWESFQATTKGNVKFPDTAIVHGIGVANGQFSSLPQFSGVYDGLIIRVPSNYNADLKTYDESTPWDGSFKFAWTDNPAWHLYNLIVNTRYGLAAYYPYVDANRFDFYQAGKWCDERVENGSPSNMAPRFTFNSVIAEPRPALDMLNYIAGAFNALVYDDLSGQIHLKVDRDQTAAMVFTPESVSSDGFNYTFTDATTRYNDISVTFINPNLDWNEDRRRIPGVTTDEANIAKFGRIPYDFIAVGCTNEYEAIRRAQYRLITALTEKTMVSFITTRLGTLLRLFDVILISDPTMGWALPGRVHDYDSDYVYLRDPIFIEENIPYVMKLQTLNGIEEVPVFVEAIGFVDRLRLGAVMPEGLSEYPVFTLEGLGQVGFAKPFRVMAVEEVEGSPYAYRISGLEINRQKYFVGDTVNPLPEFQYSYKQPTLPSEPRNLVANSGSDQALMTPSGSVIDRIFISWQASAINDGVTSYEVRWKISTDEEYQNRETTGESLYLSPVQQGASYDIQVRSITSNITKSRWISITHTVNARSVIPPALFNFTAASDELFQITLNWEYSASPDYLKTEVWGGSVNNVNTFTKLSDVAYPQHEWVHLGLGINQSFYYRIRGISKTNQPTVWSDVRGAQTSDNPANILAILNNSISINELTDTLQDTIANAGSDAVIAVQEQVDHLNASYTVKIQSDGYVAGYGLAVTANDGTPTSSFVVLANNFAFAIPGATVRYPFIAGLINGVPTVGVNGALVVDGTITATSIDTRGLTIKDMSGTVIFGSGTNLDISRIVGLGGFATLNQITSANVSTYIASAAIARAQIGALNVGTADIVDAAITTAKIGDLQVDSLKLANQSVTIPTAAQNAGNYVIASTSVAVEQVVLTSTIVLDSTFNPSINPTAGVSVFLRCYLGISSALPSVTKLARVRLYRNGTLIMQDSVSVTNGTGGSGGFVQMLVTNFLFDQPGVGTFTYSVNLNRDAGCQGSMAATSLLILGSKK